MIKIRTAHIENSIGLHLFKWVAIGFGSILDGLVTLITFGFFSSNFNLESAKALAKMRIERIKK